MLQKTIQYMGVPHVMACDGRCDKAWGINLRPGVYFDANGAVVTQQKCNDEGSNVILDGPEPPDFDDYAFFADNEVGTAPSIPQTWEGGDGKPSGVPLKNSYYMNKWCARQCERSVLVEVGEPINLPYADPNTRRYNIPTSKVRAEQRELMTAAGVDLSTVKWDPAKQTFVKV